MSYWFLLNTILLFIAIWKILSHPFLTLHIIIGAMAFLFYLFNWTRNAVFSTIRSLDHRQKKIKWANISKKILPYHRWIGTSALLFSIIHAVLVVNKFGFYFQSGKFVVGLLAMITMIFLVLTGWLRFVKPTGRLRKIHLGLGMTLFFIIFLHLLL